MARRRQARKSRLPAGSVVLAFLVAACGGDDAPSSVGAGESSAVTSTTEASEAPVVSPDSGSSSDPQSEPGGAPTALDSGVNATGIVTDPVGAPVARAELDLIAVDGQQVT